MFVMAWRAAAALVMVGVCTTALAQRIPPSERPGRERERFTDPQPPRAQYGGSIFTPPGVIPGTKRHARKHKK
jgi:hypothetical protein